MKTTRTTLAAAAALITLNAVAAEEIPAATVTATKPAETAASAPAPGAASAPTDGADLRRQLDELRQQLAVIERRAELKDEAAAAKAKENATSKFDENGFTATSADKNFQLRIKGLVQTDARVYFDDGDAAGAKDKFILRRARPIIEATLGKDYDAVLVPEFGDAPTKAPFLLDAYLNAAPFGKGLQFRVGKQRSTIGLEMNQPDPKGFFIERSLATQLTTNRDLGVVIHGRPFDEVVEYGVGVFNGAPDGAAPDYNGDVSDAKSFAARVYVKPFANGSDYVLSNLGFGIGADYRDKTGTPGSTTASGAFNNGLYNYRSDAQQTIYNWRNNAYSDGASYRYSPHVGWYAGPFGLLAEYIVSENAVTLGNRHDTLRHRAWNLSGSWVLTGENASYEGVKPSSEHSLYNGGSGALELVARISELRFDGDSFTGGSSSFANAATSVSNARAYAVGLNWYPSVNLRFSIDYTHSDFDAAGPVASPISRTGEDAILARAQISF